MSSFASFAAAANCFCSSSRYACFVSAEATVFATGRTGFTSSKESLELVVRLAVGDGVGEGRSNGSSAGVLVVCAGCLFARRGRVDWA